MIPTRIWNAMRSKTDRIEMYRPIPGRKIPKSRIPEPILRYAVALLKTAPRSIAAPMRNPVKEPRM